MKILRILIILLFVSEAYGQGRKIQIEKTYWDSSHQISSEVSFYKKRGKHIYHGDYKEYNQNGRLLSISSFVNGKRVGNLVKYYDNGKMMVEKEEQNNELNIVKYGFQDGKYALIYKTKNGQNFYKVFDSLGNFVYSTDTSSTNKAYTTLTNKITCTIKLDSYPETLVLEQLEGLVIVKLKCNSTGKVLDIEPLDSFHENALRTVIESIKKSDCYKKETELNLIETHSIIFVNRFEMQ